MKSNMITLQIAFRKAENLARKRSTKAWLMANCLIPRKRVKYLFLCYAYLRWVDNLIDNKHLTAADKNIFINRQFDLINDLIAGKETTPNHIEEIYLFHFISFATQENEKHLISMLLDMLTTLKMDAQRLEKDGMFNNKELEEYISLSTRAMFGLVFSFMFPQKQFSSNEEIGKLLWYAGTLRDLQDDLNSGFINISREDFNKFCLHKNNFFDDGRFNVWLREKILSVIGLLDAEILILKKQPLRFRLFWCLAYPIYLHKIIRIKTFDYSFSYLKKPNLKREVRAFLASVTLGIKTIFQIIL